MIETNSQKILGMLSPTDKVLDIGGWASPFNRANYVIDCQPYETRGFYAKVGLPKATGGEKEYFSKDTWIQRDFCDKDPFPFEDNEIDFVICSQTLEDIRDPIWVCSEMVRVAKKGYLEVPSRLKESCRGWEHPNVVGLSHHRWLIEIVKNKVEFLLKPHCIHTRPSFSLPRKFLDILPPTELEQWLFWDGEFSFAEKMILGLEATQAELEAFAKKHYSPLLREKIYNASTWIGSSTQRMESKVSRMFQKRRKSA